MGGEQWPLQEKHSSIGHRACGRKRAAQPGVICSLCLSPQCFGGRPVIMYTVPFADACPLTVPSADAVPNSVPSVA